MRPTYEASYSTVPKWLWYAWEPRAWPLIARRAMFVTLPVSGPLWLVFCSLASVLLWMMILPIAIFNTAKDVLWDNE